MTNEELEKAFDAHPDYEKVGPYYRHLRTYYLDNPNLGLEQSAKFAVNRVMAVWIGSISLAYHIWKL